MSVDSLAIRAQLLRDAASLDPRSYDRNELARKGQYAEACKQNWSPGDVEVESDDEVPVLDTILQTAIAKDDLVVLSDGNCYSKSAVGSLVDQGVVSWSSGRAKLPLTNTQMTDLDYALVDRDPPSETSAAVVAARERTADVIDATYDARVTPEQQQRERAMREQRRLQTWLSGQAGPRVEFAATLGASRNVDDFERLLRDLPDDKQRVCALYLFAASVGNNTPGIEEREIGVVLDRATRSAMRKPLIYYAKLPQRDCFDEDDDENYAGLVKFGRSIVISESLRLYPNEQRVLFNSVESIDRPYIYYEALRSQNLTAIDTLTPLMVRDLSDDKVFFTDLFTELLFGAFGTVPKASLLRALDRIREVRTPFPKRVNLFWSTELLASDDWSENDFRNWITREWPRYVDLLSFVPPASRSTFSRTMREYGAQGNSIFQTLLDLIVRTYATDQTFQQRGLPAFKTSLRNEIADWVEEGPSTENINMEKQYWYNYLRTKHGISL
jgi:hypothetical protein